jgi:hypothetical protein
VHPVEGFGVVIPRQQLAILGWISSAVQHKDITIEEDGSDCKRDLAKMHRLVVSGGKVRRGVTPSRVEQEQQRFELGEVFLIDIRPHEVLPEAGTGPTHVLWLLAKGLEVRTVLNCHVRPGIEEDLEFLRPSLLRPPLLDGRLMAIDWGNRHLGIRECLAEFSTQASTHGSPGASHDCGRCPLTCLWPAAGGRQAPLSAEQAYL